MDRLVEDEATAAHHAGQRVRRVDHGRLGIAEGFDPATARSHVGEREHVRRGRSQSHALLAEDEEGGEDAPVAAQYTAEFTQEMGDVRFEHVGEDRLEDDAVHRRCGDGEGDLVPGQGPLRVVELAADVQVGEAEIGVARRDVLLAPGDAGPAHVHADVRPGVTQDPGEGYGVAPHPATDLEHVVAGAQGGVPRVRGQVGGGYPVPCVGAPTGQDGQVDRDVEALEG